VADVKRFCLCGATADARSTTPGFAEGIAAVFDEHHQGAGHGTATPAQARAARVRADRAALQEVDHG
jgi:hypothetical protein